MPPKLDFAALTAAVDDLIKCLENERRTLEAANAALAGAQSSAMESILAHLGLISERSALKSEIDALIAEADTTSLKAWFAR